MSEGELFDGLQVSDRAVVDDRWKSSDYLNLKELWTEEFSLEEIAITLEKSVLSTIKKIAWKTEATLSEVLKRTDDKNYQDQTQQVYISDYPELVDLDIDQKLRNQLIQDNFIQKQERLEAFFKITSSTEEISKTKKISGLEILIEKLFVNVSSTSELIGSEIREKLVVLSSLSELFENLEYEIFYSVFPNEGGSKNTYATVGEMLDIPEYKIAEVTRNCIKKLLSWLSLLGSDLNTYITWVQLPKETVASLKFNNRMFFLPKVSINYEKLPKMLLPLSEFGLSEHSLKKLSAEGFLCLGDLKNTDYQELRLIHGIKSDLATNIMNIYEVYVNEI
jgi:hypothetical protein